MEKYIENIKRDLRNFSPEIFDKHPVLFAYLYGSYATGTVHPFSDLDIGVYAQGTSAREKLRLELMTALEIDERLAKGIESEVRVINELPLLLKGQIVTEGFLIYSRNDVLRVDFETSVRKAYFDFLPVIRSYERQYLESHIF